MQIVEQRSEQWFIARRGKLTSSEIHKIMGKDALSETAKTYLLDKVSETLGGFASLASGPALEWGTELEETAIQIYSEIRNVQVDKASFISYNEHYGGSPDGLVGTEGIVEVKCPYNSTNHFKHGLIKSDAEFKKAKTDYYYQCISNMVCANAQWCDFISFDPRVKPEYSMYIYRLHRNEDEVKSVLERVEVAAEYMKELKEKLKNKKNDIDAG